MLAALSLSNIFDIIVSARYIAPQTSEGGRREGREYIPPYQRRAPRSAAPFAASSQAVLVMYLVREIERIPHRARKYPTSLIIIAMVPFRQHCSGNRWNGFIYFRVVRGKLTRCMIRDPIREKRERAFG